MTPELKLLDKRLEALSLDGLPNAELFTARLARENRWSRDYACSVVREYKRFVLVAKSAGHAVTPSDAVDQAWHLHLTYSEAYWNHFCPEVLGRPFHHRPSRGGPDERERLLRDYRRTLESYERVFGTAPPRSIWPEPEQRFGVDRQFARIDTKENWIIAKPRWLLHLPLRRQALTSRRTLAVFSTLGAVAAGGCAATGDTFPLSVAGPSFLAFYMMFAGAAFFAAHRLRQTTPAHGMATPALDAYEVAYLAGGARRSVEVAVANLIAGGVIALDVGTGTLERRAPLRPDATALESELYGRVSESGRTLRDLLIDAERSTSDIRVRLERSGLYSEHGALLPFLVALAVPLLGVGKILIGVSRDRPVGWLVLLTFVAGVSAIGLFRPRRGPTPQGRVLLHSLQKRHARWKEHAQTSPDPAASWLPMAAGLFGLAVLADFGYPELAHGLTAASEKAKNTGYGGGDAAADGGAGGDGGGGCGGCGGCGGD